MVSLGLLILLVQFLTTPFLAYSMYRQRHWRDDAFVVWLTLGFLGVTCFILAGILRRVI